MDGIMKKKLFFIYNLPTQAFLKLQAYELDVWLFNEYKLHQ